MVEEIVWPRPPRDDPVTLSSVTEGFKPCWRTGQSAHLETILFLRATNRCVRGSRVMWRRGIGMEDGAGLAAAMH